MSVCMYACECVWLNDVSDTMLAGVYKDESETESSGELKA